MTTKQQQESLEYFRKHAAEWRSKAVGHGSASVNIIEQRNDYVLKVAAERAEMHSFLDIGCGTGELVCQAAKQVGEATGVDYAPEMIALAAKKAREENIAGASFVCSSIFDFPMRAGYYDLISANGFIEYISPQEMQTFFGLVARALSPGGSFVVGSRNRLFNLVAMNEYTLQEIDEGVADLLLKEAVAWTSARAMPKIVAGDAPPLQPAETRHKKTGIDVTTRFQYTPFQLITQLQDLGLRAVDVYPVHIHGVTPAFLSENPEVHTTVANLLQTYAWHNTQLLPQASTFMLHVRKGD